MALLHELIGNVHMHTPYSDGEASHEGIARAGRAAGLDFVIVTDHNVLVKGVEGYYGDDESGQVLLLTGEEVHDRQRLPQCNHMVIFGASRELAACAHDPQQLIDAADAAGGMSFLAHPHDPPLTGFKEPAIPWQDLGVQRFTGLEIWNYMSAFKGVLNSGNRLHQVRAAFRPEDFMTGPAPETLALWDDLLGQERRVVGIGGSDAHGTTYRIGPLEHVVFPYDYLFNCVNVHVLAPQPLSGDAQADSAMIYRAIRAGNVFIGYDLLGSTRGFRFSATGQSNSTIMGGSIRLGPGVTLQALAYERSHFRLLRHGQVVAEASGRENLTHTATRSGAYRVEVWREFRGRERAWILSNPIYVEDSAYVAR